MTDAQLNALWHAITRTARLLLEQGHATQEQLDRIEEEITAEVNAAADQALESPQPDPSTALDFLYSPTSTRPPTSSTPRTTRASRATRPPWWISST
jgi:TPP-dependent pyruvate/acetoin dehydrogenase alpha subunit